MKPPGWAGWKLTIGTKDSYYLPDGTDGQVSAGWTCAAPPKQPWGTAGQRGLHCGLGAGDIVGQDFDDM